MNGTLTLPARTPSAPRLAGPDLRTRMLWPLLELLIQLREVISRLADEQYVRRPVGVIESSIGGHVRHCLDHVRSLLAATDAGHLDYDHRTRGTPVESSRTCALDEIDALVASLERISPHALTRPLSVSVTMSAGDAQVDVLSSVGRELAYVLSHTIHHNAIVNARVQTLGGWLPDGFGYAPSTVKHLRQAGACAR